MNNDLLAIHAKSFHWASFFLSKETYNKCSSLYNFCRTLDDIADDNSDLEIIMPETNETETKSENDNIKRIVIDDDRNNLKKYTKDKNKSFRFFD